MPYLALFAPADVQWLSMRLELTGAVVVFAAAVAVGVISPRNAGLAGLALTSALNLTGQLTLVLFCVLSVLALHRVHWCRATNCNNNDMYTDSHVNSTTLPHKRSKHE